MCMFITFHMSCVCIDSVFAVVPNPAKKIATGGSGGRGGNVYVVADKSLVSLNFQNFHINAFDGEHGKGISFHVFQ